MAVAIMKHTNAPSSRLGHEAGDFLAESVIQLIQSKKTP